MKYVVMSFRCEGCNAELEAHVAAVAGFGVGGHPATCPLCGLSQGDFPDEVLRVIELRPTERVK